MNFIIKIVALIAVISIGVISAGRSQLNKENRQVVLIVKDLTSLKTLIREISGLKNLRSTYHNHLSNRNVIEKSIQQGVNFKVPKNSYALILTMKNEISTQAIYAFLQRYTSVRNVNVIVESKRRGKRNAAFIGLATSLISTIRNGIHNNIKDGDSYTKKVFDATSKGLGVFSVGMAAVSLVPNPVTPYVSAVTGLVSLGLGVARDSLN